MDGGTFRTTSAERTFAPADRATEEAAIREAAQRLGVRAYRTSDLVAAAEKAVAKKPRRTRARREQ